MNGLVLLQARDSHHLFQSLLLWNNTLVQLKYDVPCQSPVALEGSTRVRGDRTMVAVKEQGCRGDVILDKRGGFRLGVERKGGVCDHRRSCVNPSDSMAY
jgi:hypothetical protein